MVKSTWLKSQKKPHRIKKKEEQTMEVTYTRKGDYLFPDLTIEEEPAVIGKYGMLRRTFLKENKKNWYQSMLLTGKLERHLEEIDRTADEQMERISAEMAQREGVDEKLKAADQMEWIRRMNSIRSRAEETVLRELVYS